jgi:hypothetical protein
VFESLSLAIKSPIAKAQLSDDFKALYDQAVRLYQTGKYVEETEPAKRALAFAQRQFDGRCDEAEPLMKARDRHR